MDTQLNQGPCEKCVKRVEDILFVDTTRSKKKHNYNINKISIYFQQEYWPSDPHSMHFFRYFVESRVALFEEWDENAVNVGILVTDR